MKVEKFIDVNYKKYREVFYNEKPKSTLTKLSNFFTNSYMY